MKKQYAMYSTLLVAALIQYLLMAGDAIAHCDTLDGPVVLEAQAALASGDVKPLLKWVTKEEEDTVRNAFRDTLAVRSFGEKAEELADMYFFETLVRIHRAGEGAPYTGIKRGMPVDPAVALADKSIATGSANMLIAELREALVQNLTKRFVDVIKASKKRNDNISAGRDYVAAYVEFTHFAERLHDILRQGDTHH